MEDGSASTSRSSTAYATMGACFLFMWDGRVSNLFLKPGSQHIYGGSKSDFVNIWDLHGGGSLVAFQNYMEWHQVFSTPIGQILERLQALGIF